MAADGGRIKIKEVIIVEGKYDKNTLSQVADATIITTGGFSLFKDKDLRSLLLRLAKERGVIVLTDADGAGLVIRNRLRGFLPPEMVKHAYIPALEGKEARKKQAGKAGLLGVEGISPEMLRQALINVGATESHAPDCQVHRAVTKKDLYGWGLSGAPNSAKLRRELQEKLNLPKNLSSKALCEVLTMLGLYDQAAAYYIQIQCKIPAAATEASSTPAERASISSRNSAPSAGS
jgi:ribonuclease M5